MEVNVHPTERPLSTDEIQELHEALSDALTLLDERPSDPEALADALTQRVEELREDPSRAGRALDEAGFLLGLLVGQQICELAGWQWTYLQYDNGFEGVAVVTEDRSFVCMPVHYTYGLLKDTEGDNTLHALFDALRKGAVPPAQERAYIPLS